MEPPKVSISRVLPRTGPGTLSSVEAYAILQVAFLAGDADSRIDDAEEDAFAELARSLKGLVETGSASMNDDALEGMLDGFDEMIESKGRKAALTLAVKELTRPLTREIAYKVSVAMSVADMDRADAEEDFDDQLLVALGLTEDQASLLTEDVYSALER
jgi:hypothetical protein